VSKSYNICCSRSRRPVRKPLDTPSYPAYRIEKCVCTLVGCPQGQRPIGRSRRRWRDNIKMCSTVWTRWLKCWQLRIRSNGGIMWTQRCISRLHKGRVFTDQVSNKRDCKLLFVNLLQADLIARTPRVEGLTHALLLCGVAVASHIDYTEVKSGCWKWAWYRWPHLHCLVSWLV
jgi:hypothetical protein